MNIIKGRDVLENIKKQINEYQVQFSDAKPKVAIVRIGNHGDDITYERSIVKKFEQLNIQTQLETFDLNVTHDLIVEVIERLNNDNTVHGIIMLRPLPAHIDDDHIAQILDPNKDIDGMSHSNIARVFSQEDKGFVPCTPQAVVEVINYLDIDLRGLNITIVGAGMAVGRPLSILLLNERATITVCRGLTKDLVKECKDADIIITATGVKNLITAEHVKKGAIVIDVGINLDDDNKIVGDVDFENVAPLTKYITPVPGGVGSITTYILARQLYEAMILQGV